MLMDKRLSIWSDFFVGHYELEAQCVEPVLLTFHFVSRKLYTEPSIGNFYQISINNLANYKQELPVALTDQNEKS